jgi:FkbM family methyltransferase
VTCRGRSFEAVDTPRVRAAVAEFCSAADGTLRLIDAVAPRCDRFIDLRASLGLTACYAAAAIREVHAFEASLADFAVLEANVAANPRLAGRIAARNLAVGDATVTIQCGTAGDPGADEAAVQMREAASLLRDVGLDERTLLRLDVEGAENAVIEAIADLLTVTVPIVHVRFRPLSAAISRDAYVDAVARLHGALAAAGSLAHYPYMYVFAGDGWVCIDPPSRPHFLRHHLLAPRRIGMRGTPRYGFTDSAVFTDERIEGLAP